LVGSYPQPDWLIDREGLGKQAPPRVRVKSLWRIAEPWLQGAQDDATLLAIRDQERAGIDIVTDGETRRESYSSEFATALEGLDLERAGCAPTRIAGVTQAVPRVVGKIRRRGPIAVRDTKFLRENTARTIKVTVPGPFTMAQQVQDDFYGDELALGMDYAAALNEEIADLFAAGADSVQIDEPYLQAYPEKAKRYGVAVINRAVEGITGTVAIHLCFGYAHFGMAKPDGYSFLAELARAHVAQISIEAAQPNLDCSILAQLPNKKIVLGVLDLSFPNAETPSTVAARIRRAIEYVSPDRLIIAPDCGMKYLPREVAFRKLVAMVEGARIVRQSL
jgi:5-methyltetrahydropteroyltriglutamate--homocysteine methyltransferase